MHMKNSMCLKQRQKGLNSSDIGLNSFGKVISSKAHFMFSLQLGKKMFKKYANLSVLFREVFVLEKIDHITILHKLDFGGIV